MKWSNRSDKARKESKLTSDRGQDRMVFVNSMNRFFGENNLPPVSKDRDAIVLQMYERYLQYAKRNSNRPAA